MEFHRRAFNRLFAGLGIGAAAASLSRHLSQAAQPASAIDVTIQHEPRMRFVPEPVKIQSGDTVRWINPFPIAHTVTFDPTQAQKASNVVLPAGVAPFGSDDLEEDGTFSHTFTVKGTYKYVCKYHEEQGMVGTVIVS